MSMDSIVYALDLIGVFVFALSGGLTAVRHRLDLFGVVVIAFMPAVGGGTLRDLLLGEPVFWLGSEIYLIIAAMGGILAFVAPKFWSRMKALVWLDAIGLSLFAVIGAAKAFSLGYGPIVIIVMGTITATASGLIRDVICNETPMLLKQEVYATAAIFGAVAFWVCLSWGALFSISLGIGTVAAFLIRAAGILFSLRLPQAPSLPNS